jgi:hypothetical protein
MIRYLAPTVALMVVTCAARGASPEKWTWADRPFDGTWVVRPEQTIFDHVLRAPIFSFEGGLFRRSDCHGGAIEVPADGQDHEVKDQPLFDALAVHVTNERHAEITEKLSGIVAWRGRYSVSGSGDAMTLDYEDDRAAKPVTGEVTFHRDGAVVSGSRPLSGTWRPEKIERLSPSGLTLTLTTQPTTTAADHAAPYSMMAGDGSTASGKFDMHDAPLQGYLQGSSVALSRLRPDTLQINRSRNGELVEMSRATVSPDGQTLTLTELDWVCQAKATFTLQRQSPQ